MECAYCYVSYDVVDACCYIVVCGGGVVAGDVGVVVVSGIGVVNIGCCVGLRLVLPVC